MATQRGTVIVKNGKYYFKNDDGDVVQTLATRSVGQQNDPKNQINLEPFRDSRMEVEGQWERDYIVDVTSIRIV